MKSQTTRTLVGMGILTAIVVVLQAFASTIHFGPFSITLVLAPMVIGSALYGWKAGGWLGFVFGVMVLLSGDAAPFLAINVPATIILCLLKGILAGIAAGFVYNLLANKSKLGAVICAGIACPVVNTGVFLLGCLVFFLDTVKGWGAGLGYESVGAYFLFGVVGINFVVELAINLALSTAIVSILNIVQRGAGASAGVQGE